MNKKSTNNSQQSIFKKLWNTKPFWVALIAVGILVLVSLFVYGVRTGDPIKNSYKQITIPSTWNQTYVHKNSFTECFFSDITCPQTEYKYSVSNLSLANSQIASVRSELLQKGYKSDEKCFRADCMGYYFKVHNNSVTVRVSAEEGGRHVYLTLEKN